MEVLISTFFHFVKPHIYLNFVEYTKHLYKIGIILPIPEVGAFRL